MRGRRVIIALQRQSSSKLHISIHWEKRVLWLLEASERHKRLPSRQEDITIHQRVVIDFWIVTVLLFKTRTCIVLSSLSVTRQRVHMEAVDSHDAVK